MYKVIDFYLLGKTKQYFLLLEKTKKIFFQLRKQSDRFLFAWENKILNHVLNEPPYYPILSDAFCLDVCCDSHKPMYY